MFQHAAAIVWKSSGPDFLAGKYSREHTWAFDGGAVVAASSSPHNVPLPWSNPACVDPEESFVASVASCHMLWFLFLARQQGFEILSYTDHAVGRMTQNDAGQHWFSSIQLNPAIACNGKRPTPEEEASLHDAAHHRCFIANSIKTAVTIGNPRP